MEGATTESVGLRIGGVTMAVRAASPGLRLEVKGRSRTFVADGASPDVRLEASWADLSSYTPAGSKVFDPGQLWTVFRNNGHYSFQFTSPATGSIPYSVARFRADFTSGEILFHRPFHATDETVSPLDYPLDELLVANYLTLGRGVILHGCGLINESGEGVLFAGSSGAGKSTTARLWMGRPGVKILSDDRVIVRRNGDGCLWMYGTPWHSDAKQALPDGAPLSRVFLLAHGARNELQALQTAEAVRRLFVTTFPPFYNAGALDFTLAFLEEIARAVPCDEFRFLPEDSAVEFVKKTEETRKT